MSADTTAPTMGAPTPWGPAQTVHEHAPGIVSVSTAGHGGFWLSPARRAEMPAVFRDIPTFAGGNWYEEDCDAALVAASFRGVFTLEEEARARGYLRTMAESTTGFERYRPLRYVA